MYKSAIRNSIALFGYGLGMFSLENMTARFQSIMGITEKLNSKILAGMQIAPCHCISINSDQ